MQQDLNQMEKRISNLEAKMKFVDSDNFRPEAPRSRQKEDADDSRFSEQMKKILWNGIFFISDYQGTGTLASNNAGAPLIEAGRTPDSSAGNLFSPARESKFRCSFFISTAQTDSLVYIASPAISTSTIIGSSITDNTKSFVGIKIVGGVINLVSYNHTTGNEQTVATTKVITDDTTHRLEIIYKVRSADFYYDNDYIGSIRCVIDDDSSIEIFYPLLTSVESTGSVVNLHIDNYEFIQERNN